MKQYKTVPILGILLLLFASYIYAQHIENVQTLTSEFTLITPKPMNKVGIMSFW
ncbi:hypothetical protein SAMN05444409_1617 [Epilithonimonas zeae]|uniref:Uncharacterized protein n=1 Tax=Epilithonimonas zeae TaxID=1416779 RepID=A0A1N6G2T6_9FLAO|nr:hypothetical protein SAMN05444409_1617 [Epilithonimonas zeae]